MHASMNLQPYTYGRGRNEYFVVFGRMYLTMNGGFEQTFRVRANNWREAKRYVENLDPFRIWKDYPKLLTECGGDPFVRRVFDRNRKYFETTYYWC